jgi:hypothetical protein
MPHKKKSRRYLAPLVLFTLAGWALWALGRNEPTATEAPDAEPSGTPDRAGPTLAPARTHATWSKRRLATSLAFATLFFGGAAFSAGAGDVVADAIEGDTTTDVTSTEEAPEEPAPGRGRDGEEVRSRPPRRPVDSGLRPPGRGPGEAAGGEGLPSADEARAGGASAGRRRALAPLPDGRVTTTLRRLRPAITPAAAGSGNCPSSTRAREYRTRPGRRRRFFATIWLPPVPTRPRPPASEAGLRRHARARAGRANVDWALVWASCRPVGSTAADGLRSVRRPLSGWPSSVPGARPRVRFARTAAASSPTRRSRSATTTARLACALSSSGWRPRSRGCSTGSYATRASPSTRAGASTWLSASSTCA